MIANAKNAVAAANSRSSTRAVAAFALLALLGIGVVRAEGSNESRGRALAFASDKGNCLGCHFITGGAQMGDIGPPLVSMKSRFPERARLRAQIWDAGDFNATSVMPPFGRHEILSESEIDAIIEYLYTL